VELQAVARVTRRRRRRIAFHERRKGRKGKIWVKPLAQRKVKERGKRQGEKGFKGSWCLKLVPKPRTTRKWGGGAWEWLAGDKEEEAREDWTEEARKRKSFRSSQCRTAGRWRLHQS
jgi:hypothetical protein